MTALKFWVRLMTLQGFPAEGARTKFWAAIGGKYHLTLGLTPWDEYALDRACDDYVNEMNAREEEDGI